MGNNRKNSRLHGNNQEFRSWRTGRRHNLQWRRSALPAADRLVRCQPRGDPLRTTRCLAPDQAGGALPAPLGHRHTQSATVLSERARALVGQKLAPAHLAFATAMMSSCIMGRAGDHAADRVPGRLRCRPLGSRRLKGEDSRPKPRHSLVSGWSMPVSPAKSIGLAGNLSRRGTFPNRARGNRRPPLPTL